MKKFLSLLVLIISSITAYADNFVYVSNVEQGSTYNNYTDTSMPCVVVTVSARPGVLDRYPDGFMVTVRPANHIFDSILSYETKTVRLTRDNPSARVTYLCSENAKACRSNDFIVNARL